MTLVAHADRTETPRATGDFDALLKNFEDWIRASLWMHWEALVWTALLVLAAEAMLVMQLGVNVWLLLAVDLVLLGWARVRLHVLHQKETEQNFLLSPLARAFPEFARTLQVQAGEATFHFDRLIFKELHASYQKGTLWMVSEWQTPTNHRVELTLGAKPGILGLTVTARQKP